METKKIEKLDRTKEINRLQKKYCGDFAAIFEIIFGCANSKAIRTTSVTAYGGI